MKEHKYKTSVELSKMAKEIWDLFAEDKLTPFERTIIIDSLKDMDKRTNAMRDATFIANIPQQPEPTLAETPKATTDNPSVN